MSKYRDCLQFTDENTELMEASDFPKVTQGGSTKAEVPTQDAGLSGEHGTNHTLGPQTR